MGYQCNPIHYVGSYYLIYRTLWFLQWTGVNTYVLAVVPNQPMILILKASNLAEKAYLKFDALVYVRWWAHSKNGIQDWQWVTFHYVCIFLHVTRWTPGDLNNLAFYPMSSEAQESSIITISMSCCSTPCCTWSTNQQCFSSCYRILHWVINLVRTSYDPIPTHSDNWL